MSMQTAWQPVALPTNLNAPDAIAGDSGCVEAEPSRRPGIQAWRWLVVLGLFVAAALFALYVLDGPVAVYTLNHSPPELFAELLAVAEPFGNGLGVLLIALLIWRLNPSSIQKVPRLLTMALGAGLSADLLKLVVTRWRPMSGQFDPAHAATSFASWFPLLGVPSAEQSFPSAHTATAMGLALALCWLYPRGRVVFLAAPLLVGLQRIAYGSHFASDVCVGAAIGWSVATFVLRSSVAARWFDRLEASGMVEVDAAALDDIELHTELVIVPPAFDDVLPRPRQTAPTKSPRHRLAA